MAFRIVLACLLVAMATATTSVGSCVVKSNPDFRPDPDDCSVFYVCANEILYKFNCSDSVFDPVTRTCVAKGSTYDRCTKKDTPAQTVICLPGSRALIPHPENCAQYYNCSAPRQGYKWPQHLRECPFSQLYNVMTKQCEHYSMVKCGDRQEPISHCDYRANQCEAAHCIPCIVRYPSCKGLPDGLNQWVGREDSPYYVVCEGGRMVYSGMCTQEYGPQIFDKLRKMCVEGTP
ncbi:uncharacterized protein [Haliotis asinina]|uniref:uncharacterized protein n=1 Tax=Haliotis asinina TaxID=109174 RepID=UPI00353214D7